MADCHVLDLGRIGYQEALDIQLRIVERMKATEPDDAVLLLLEHEPVITLGRSASREHLLVSPEELARRGVELHESSRGGDITYHGPGQLVGYPIVRLAAARRDVHRFLRGIEATIISALREFGIEGRRVEGLTGVWVGDAKVAAIGIAFTRWISYHGFALNIATDLDAFRLIVPCGIGDKPVTSMARLLGSPPDWAAVEAAVIGAFLAEFGFHAARHCRTLDDLPATVR